MADIANNSQGVLPFIEHRVESNSISQRAYDGYVNATALCKACNKQFNDYTRLASTQEFLRELNSETGIPVSELIQTLRGGDPKTQGSWVHPKVAINLGQWASPRFAVLVSNWVFDWMNAGKGNVSNFPYHIRRYLINLEKIPPTHFSMLDQMTVKLLGSLEAKGYVIPINLMPDISLGRMFCTWLRDKGYDPDSFPTYKHRFDDGRRPIVDAKLYPNTLMTEFNLQLEDWITKGRAMTYFSSKDKNAVEPLKLVIEEKLMLENNKPLTLKN